MAAISAAIAGIGLGLSAFGAVSQRSAAKEQSAIQQQMIRQEQEQEENRKKAMELDARRRQMEIIRQSQRVRAMGLTAANAQGAAFGSGLQGGYGQASGQTGVNLLGVQQNLQLGETSFDINSQISQSRIQLAQAQGAYASAGALTSLGGTILHNASTFGNILGSAPGLSGFSGRSSQPSYGGFLSGIGSRGIY